MKNSNLCKKVGKFQRANLSNYALNITVQENDMWKRSVQPVSLLLNQKLHITKPFWLCNG
jgi:hypothetical protein